MSEQSSGFWLFSSFLHWLKELGFSAPDPNLFWPVGAGDFSLDGTVANSVAVLPTYLVSKRREGILSHFPSCMGSHFKEELASFGTPMLFDDEVLAKVVAASREDSNLDAQLIIAKAFTHPVFSWWCKRLWSDGALVRHLPLPRVIVGGAGVRIQVEPSARFLPDPEGLVGEVTSS